MPTPGRPHSLPPPSWTHSCLPGLLPAWSSPHPQQGCRAGGPWGGSGGREDGVSHTRPSLPSAPPRVLPTTPVGPSLPGHRSTRPYTVFELEQVRQQSRKYAGESWAGLCWEAGQRAMGLPLTRDASELAPALPGQEWGRQKRQDQSHLPSESWGDLAKAAGHLPSSAPFPDPPVPQPWLGITRREAAQGTSGAGAAFPPPEDGAQRKGGFSNGAEELGAPGWLGSWLLSGGSPASPTSANLPWQAWRGPWGWRTGLPPA